MDYNLAVQRSNNEEMLLNLIRIKYFEQPLFLQVGSVASSFSFGITGGSGSTVPDQRDFSRSIYSTYTPNISSNYTDSPTVTYTPYQGQAYAQQVLAEMDFDRFLILYRSGWDIEFLMRVLVSRFGLIDHSYDTRIGHNPESHARFLETVKIISDMDDEGNIDFNIVSSGKEKRNILVMTMRFTTANAADELGRLIGVLFTPISTERGNLIAQAWLAPVKEIELAEDIEHGRRMTMIPFRLRGGLRAMDVLAQGAEVPQTLLKSKKGFDLRKQFMDICDIRVASDKPTGAYVATKYGDDWYFISDDDSHSKEAFQLMLNIFALQSADPPKNTPILTLPVGGN
jgi:hypothetical protein